MELIPLTEHDDAGKPGETGRRDDEIEITAEMIEAGVMALLDWNVGDDNLEYVVISVFEAMSRAVGSTGTNTAPELPGPRA